MPVIARFRWLMSVALALTLSLMFVFSSIVYASVAVSSSVTLTRLSHDIYTNANSQHQTEVEPDTFSFGSTIVSAFQVGRFPAPDGGSDNIGWATSTNSGGSWSHGFLSGITKIAGGSYSRVSDPVVTYDARHKIWMIVSIAFDTASPGTNAILVSRSTNGGLTWVNPVPVHVQGPPSILDKPWIVCDNTTSSPHYGNCYVEWDDANQGKLIFMSTSTNGGTIWGSPKTTATPKAHGVGGQPLVKSNGNVIVPIDNASMTGVLVFTSTDGGKSWGAATSLSDIKFHQPAGGLRADPFISASMDRAGTVYIVWADCRYVTNCAANQIVLLTYSGSTTLSVVKSISIDQPNSILPDFMIPNIAVDKATSGSTVHLKLTYYYYPVANCNSSCDLDVDFFSCIGTTCTSQLQLAGPMKLTWLPKTDHGVLTFCLPACRMVGDYISTSIVNGKVFPVFATANAPAVGTDCSAAGAVCQEAIFTVAGGLS